MLPEMPYINYVYMALADRQAYTRDTGASWLPDLNGAMSCLSFAPHSTML